MNIHFTDVTTEAWESFWVWNQEVVRLGLGSAAYLDITFPILPPDLGERIYRSIREECPSITCTIEDPFRKN